MVNSERAALRCCWMPFSTYMRYTLGSEVETSAAQRVLNSQPTDTHALGLLCFPPRGEWKCQEAQEASGCPCKHQEGPGRTKRPQEDPGEAPGRPRKPQEAPRGRKRPPRRTQEAPGSPRRPRRPQETPGTMKRQESQGPQGRVRSVAIELVLEIDVRISDYGYRYISSCSDVRLRCSRSSTNTRTFCVGARPCR